MSKLDDLKAKLDAARAATVAAALTPDEIAELDARAQLDAETEAARTAATKRRSLKIAERLEAAEAKAGRAYLVQAVDLCACFSRTPPLEHLPNGGFVIVRNPPAATVALIVTESETKTMAREVLAARIAADCTIDPSTDETTERVRLGMFFETYPDAAMKVAGVARALGGAKQEAETKRG